MGPDATDPSTTLLLKRAGFSSEIRSLIPLTGGANNRVYKVEFFDAPPLILKHYFTHPQDLRPRLKVEFAFLEYAWQEGIRSIPRPIFKDEAGNCALYSYLEGTSPQYAAQPFAEEALSFLIQLNLNRERGKHLAFASEACLRIDDLFSIVEKKLARLNLLAPETAVEREAQAFVKDELLPAWSQIREDSCKAALHFLEPSEEDFIITPSDFGLHNALFSSSGFFSFLDFEYAGWDDPAKTICDFFLQPKIPVPFIYFDLFSRGVAALSKDPSKTLERVKLLFPILKIKWCCIVLNLFLKEGKSRRNFAKSDQLTLQRRQIDLARSYLCPTSTSPLPFTQKRGETI